MKDKKKSTIDKIIMGAIIGTAIGSAVSLTLAPQKGKETRDYIKEKGQDVGNVARETGTGFFRLFKAVLRRLLFGRKKTAPKHATSERMKEIPDEMEVYPP